MEHRDRVLSKVELLDGVWGHRFIADANLTTRVKELRRAVGDDGRQQRTIGNVRGRGYRFVADVIGAGTQTNGVKSAAMIGREAEVAMVIQALVEAPVVTVTGAGGVGKSTIARVVAERVVSSFRDGVRLVELSALASGDGSADAPSWVTTRVGDESSDTVTRRR